MYGWLTFYHHGHEVAKDYKPHMTELQTRIQKVKLSSILMFGRDEECNSILPKCNDRIINNSF